MKKKPIFMALCFTVPFLYFSYRIWNISKNDTTAQNECIAVASGRYYLDDGTHQTYLQISNCDTESHTFDMELHHVDGDDLKEFLFHENYRPIDTYTCKTDAQGNPLFDEKGMYLLYSAEECEQINLEAERQVHDAVEAWCAAQLHSYHYEQQTDFFTYADWYQETGADAGGNPFTTTLIAFPQKIMFEDYIWIFDEAQEEKQ